MIELLLRDFLSFLYFDAVENVEESWLERASSLCYYLGRILRTTAEDDCFP